MGPRMNGLSQGRNLRQKGAAVAVETRRPLWEAQ